jgi:hypothetical protein
MRIETNSDATITHCTITNNSVPYVGGGIYSYSYSPPQITDCIIWGNTPDNLGSAFSSEPVITYSDVEGGWSGTGNIDEDPLFVAPEDYDYHLTGLSPCIDSGEYAGINDDIDDDSRPLGNGYDMGADEYVPGTYTLQVILEDYPSTVQPGSNVEFTTVLLNADAYNNKFDEVIMRISGPASRQRKLYQGLPITLTSGESISKTVEQPVSAYAPLGTYHVDVSVFYLGDIIDSDGFDVEVTE